MAITNYRPTWAEIDLGAVRHNLDRIRKMLHDDVKIMAVVKANAYGHGICQVGRVLSIDGVDYMGVASLDEAVRLREDEISTPILVLGSVLPSEAKAAIERDITLTLCNYELLEAMCSAARKCRKRAKAHVKIDTGMGRIGVWHEEAAAFIRHVSGFKEIEIEGIYTHFSSAGRDNEMTEAQITALEKVIDSIKETGIDPLYKHSANSIALVDREKAHLNLVRPGILLYGIYPKPDFRKIFDLRPVMSLKTRIVFIKDTPPGRAISYGRTYITQQPTRIATIPIGYADGYGRILSNKAEALVRGRYVKVVGRVTMDQTLLDVGHVEGVKVGDEVVLIGKQGEVEIPVERVAKLSGTIPYEIVVGIMDRVPRVYKG
ncbi:MAG: alanine racemase [Candidatus Omnitrophica bacterium]|nr:alanine racemase [Candidatus Omnitrophota bacterium]MDD4012636.1 alanine racemase [Candidatus Omnitrophota bacterium]